MTKNSNLPPAPKHLTPSTSAWWVSVLAEYALEPSDVLILEVAATQWDRASAARDSIAKNELGALTKDRFGQLREHPAVAIEQNATRLFLAALRQLGLGLEPSADSMRLPDPVAPQYREDD